MPVSWLTQWRLERSRAVSDAIYARNTDPNGVASRAVAQAAKFTWQRAARSAIDVYRILLS